MRTTIKVEDLNFESHYQVVRLANGRWAMAQVRGAEICPAGYCSGPFRELKLDEVRARSEMIREQTGEVIGLDEQLFAIEAYNSCAPNAHKFHHPGHSTAEEAQACWDLFIEENADGCDDSCDHEAHSEAAPTKRSKPLYN